MPKVTKGAKVPPKKAAGRKSIRQAEVLEGLEMLKTGKGEKVTDEKDREWLVVELDVEKAGTVEKATAALYNARWRFNPANKVSGNQAEFDRLFESAGHGGLKIYGDGDRILLAAVKTYVGRTTPAEKAAPKKSTAKKSTAKRTSAKTQVTKK